MELVDHHDGILRSNGAGEVLGNFVVLVEGFGNHANHVVVGNDACLVAATLNLRNNFVYPTRNFLSLLCDFQITLIKTV